MNCGNHASYYNCFSSPRGYKWVPQRVEVDIVYERAFGAQLKVVRDLTCTPNRDIDK